VECLTLSGAYDGSINMWRCECLLPNIVVAWRFQTVKCEQCYLWCTTCVRLYYFGRGVWPGHLQLHTGGKKELPREVIVKLTPIVALDTLDLAAELGTDKKQELGCNIPDVHPIISTIIIDAKQQFKPKFSNSIEFLSNSKYITILAFLIQNPLRSSLSVNKESCSK
jgi:hypothetical protein